MVCTRYGALCAGFEMCRLWRVCGLVLVAIYTCCRAHPCILPRLRGGGDCGGSGGGCGCQKGPETHGLNSDGGGRLARDRAVAIDDEGHEGVIRTAFSGGDGGAEDTLG